MGRGATLAAKTAIQDQRHKLLARISTFHHTAENFYSTLQDDNLLLEDDDDEGAQDSDDDDDEGEEEGARPEDLRLKMPSSLMQSFDQASRELRQLASQELKLREGQANDALKQLRLLIGHKTLLFKESVRRATTTATRTRAWDDVNSVEDKIKDHAQIYNLARSAIHRLGASADILEKYRELTEDHLVVSEDIINAARTGQRNDVLPWIWKLDGQYVQEDDNWMDECECCGLDIILLMY